MDGVLENFKFNRNTSTVDYGNIASLYDLAIRLVEATVEHYFCSKLYLFRSNYFSFRNENFFLKNLFIETKRRSSSISRADEKAKQATTK